MREPVLVDAPYLAPGMCAICMGSQGAMVDTQVDDGPHRLYVCLDNCLPTFARIAGYLSPDQAEELAVRLAGAAEREQVLMGKLNDQLEDVVLALPAALKQVWNANAEPAAAAG